MSSASARCCDFEMVRALSLASSSVGHRRPRSGRVASLDRTPCAFVAEIRQAQDRASNAPKATPPFGFDRDGELR